jgi:uncharacterized protein YndB with AHSA1/START domain
MSDTTTHHGTIVVEQTIVAPVARVYAAFADAKERERWGAPSDTAVFRYEEADFRIGVRDVAICGAKADPRFRVDARYVDISPERRVVWAETISEAGKQTLAANITTFELAPDGERTRLRVTVQVTSFVGPGMIDNTKAGHMGSLASMARHFEKL